MKQKHEKFEVCRTIEAANEFLAKSHIHPKSISVDERYEEVNGKHDIVVYFFIGYTESKKEHHFRVEKFVVEADQFFFHGLNGALKKVEEEAEKYDGVVCQDISFDDNKLEVYFLIAEKEKE